MGIQGLLSVFENHATLNDEELKPRPAVVDGPAWAYYLLWKCRCLGGGEPSYDLLVTSAIEWLRLMECNGLQILAIYFDQHLPQSKLPVRMQRVVSATNETRQCNSLFSSGVPLSCASHPQGSPALIHRIFNASGPGRTELPTPPFLVPALMEGLRAHESYGKLVMGVPGEADAFCARRARKLDKPSYIFTSDSDLLVHKVGKADVIMFKDLYKRTRGNKFTSFVFSPSAIAFCLDLDSAEDLRKFAYLKSLDSHKETRGLVRDVQKRQISLEGYAEFIALYDQAISESPKDPIMLDGQTLHRRSMDPRVSEVILDYQSPLPEPRIMRLFLPSLLEDGNRASPWDGSLFVRQLAFTLPQRLLEHPAHQLQEFRKVQNGGQKGRDVDLTIELGEIRDLISLILGLLNRCDEAFGGVPGDVFWMALCCCLNIENPREERDPEDLFIIQTLRKYNKRDISQAQDIPWDAIHLLAHIQATLYSLRIFKQVADGIGSVGLNRIDARLDTIRLSLQSLSPISRWPDIAILPTLLSPSVLSRTVALVIATSTHGPNRLSKLFSKSDASRLQDYDLRKKQKKMRKEAARMKPRGDPNNRFGALAD